MQDPQSDREFVLDTRERQQCMESHLVLDAAGISSEVVHRQGRWRLVVNRDDLEMAAAELEEYRRENPVKAARPPRITAVHAGAGVGVFVYAFVLVLLSFLDVRWGLRPLGRMQAGLVMEGQWWRTVTALTLHVDAGHLLGNLVFGSVFGLLAGRILGGGVAWLSIVLAGTLGNFINAVVQQEAHTSIGASTAVFAALGILVAHALSQWRDDGDKRFRRWTPLIGGICLFAYTGIGGERTDVLAHVTGGLAGLVFGWLGSRLPERWLASPSVQLAAGFLALLVVLIAWVFATSSF